MQPVMQQLFRLNFFPQCFGGQMHFSSETAIFSSKNQLPWNNIAGISMFRDFVKKSLLIGRVRITAKYSELSMATASAHEEGEKLRDRCIQLFQDDKLLQAARIERQLANEFPDIHAASAELLAPIVSCSKEAEKFNIEFASTEGWKCVRKGKDAHDVSVWFRQVFELSCALLSRFQQFRWVHGTPQKYSLLICGEMRLISIVLNFFPTLSLQFYMNLTGMRSFSGRGQRNSCIANRGYDRRTTWVPAGRRMCTIGATVQSRKQWGCSFLAEAWIFSWILIV